MDETQQLQNGQPDERQGVPALPQLAPPIVDILEHISDALFTVDEHWSITYINRRTEEIWGQRRADLLGRNVWAVFPQAVGTPAYYAYLEAMQERRAVTVDYFAPSVNRWLHARAYPSATGLVVHLSDITERKAAEVAEREQRRSAEAQRDSLVALTGALSVEQVMQQILASAALVVPSEAGCIMLFEGNRGHVAYLRGFSPAAEAFFQEYWFPTSSITGGPVLSDKQPYFVPDTQADPTWIILPGSEWVRSSLGMPIELQGEVIGLLVVDSATAHYFQPADMEKLQAFAHYAGLALANAHNMTQLEAKVVARTAELNDAKERVEAILNDSLDGILLVHSDLRIEQTNAAFHRLLACAPDEPDARTLYDLIHPDDGPRLQAVIEAERRDRVGQRVEMRCYRKNGTFFEAEWSVSYLATTTSHAASFVCTLRDITERKQTQNVLAEERNLLRTLIDTIPDTIYIKDTNHRFVLINSTGAHATGWTPEEMISQDDFTLLPAKLATQFYAEEERIFQTGLPRLAQEEYAIGPDGKPVWLAITKVPLRNLQREIIGLVGINRDISEQKQRERQLRYYASLQENVSDAVIATDMAFRVQSWNRAAETIYGWRAEEVMGQRINELLPTRYPSVEENDTNAGQALFANGQWQGEIVQHRKDGTELYMLSSVTLLKDEQGIPFGVVGINHDITARKRVDKALHEQRDFLQLVIDSVPDLITVNDRTGHFHLVNASAAQIYGLKPAEMVGKTDAEVNPNPSEVAYFLQTDQATLDSEQVVSIPEQTIQGRYYQTSKIPLKNSVGPPERLLVVSFDITQHKAAEAALQQALQKEKELGELKSRFFSMASHEFRNPLVSILLMTETLATFHHRLTEPQIKQHLSKILTQVARLRDSTDDVMKLAQLQAPQTEYKPEWFDLDGLCCSILAEFQGQPDSPPRLAYTNADTHRQVYLDKKLMRQVITNLLSNALKYSLADKLVRVSLNYNREALVLQVQDEGIGIPAADLTQLFEPFHRADNVGRIAGTGLGLTIVKAAVELQGGTIAVESQSGIGTTFTVRIPCLPSGAYAG